MKGIKKAKQQCAVILLMAAAVSMYGQRVETYNLKTNRIEEKSYESIVSYKSGGIRIVTEAGTVIEISVKQKIYIEEKGWVSYEEDREWVREGKHVLVKEGDKVREKEIKKIEETGEMEFETYINVSGNHNYFKKGILVHNISQNPDGSYDYSQSGGTDVNTGGHPGGSTGENTGEGGGGGGGGGGSSSGPSAEETAASEVSEILAESQKLVEELKSRGIDGKELEEAEKKVSEAQAELAGVQAELRAQAAGDPVLVTTGRYVYEETDVQGSGKSFTLERTLVTENKRRGALGPYWHLNIDSCLIRGITEVSSKQAADVREVYKKLSDNLGRAGGYASLYSSCRAKTEEIRKLCDWSGSIREGLEKAGEQAEKLHVLNRYVLTPGTPEYYERCGNGNMVLIDEKGVPVYFDYIGSGKWEARDEKMKGNTKLESMDGGGAESTGGFIVTGREGVKKYYDGYGSLTRIEKADGRRSEVERFYAGELKNRIEGITDENGRKYKCEWKNGLLEKIEGEGGQSAEYGYTNGILSSVRDEDGDEVRYEYEGERLAKIEKADGSYIEIQYGYDSNTGEKLVTATVNEEGYAERFEYDISGKQTVHTDPAGVKTWYYYDEKHRTTKEIHADGTVMEYRYDGEGNIAEEKLNGVRTEYRYDGRGNRTEAVYADGSLERWIYNGTDRKTYYRDRDGAEWQWVYDGKGRCTAVYSAGVLKGDFRYDESGRLWERRDAEGRVTEYEYDKKGNVTGVRQNGGEEKREYDERGRVTKYTDAEGSVWKYQYTEKTIREESPAGLERVYTWNNRKDLTGIQERDSITGETRRAEYVYDRRHLLKEEAAVSAEGEKETVVSYRYDGAGKLTEEKRGGWKTEYVYDSAGRVSEIKLSREGSGEVYREQYGYGRKGSTEYRERIDGAGGKVRYEYDLWKRITGITNAAGEKSEREVSAGGRVKAEQSAHGGVYRYTCDREGRVTGVGEEGGNAVQVRYNRDGSIASKTDREGNITEYAYDGAGQALSRHIHMT